MIDPRLAGLLSDFFLDISKAFFIATFITPKLEESIDFSGVFFILIKGLFSVSICLWFAREFLKFKEVYE